MASLNDTALKGLQRLPGWRKALRDGAVQVTQLEASFTNWVYRCDADDAAEPSTVLLRIYGMTEGLFSRHAELLSYRLVDAVGLAPKLLSQFEHGRIEQFLLNHSTVTPVQMRNPDVSHNLARSLSEFHFKTSTEWYRRRDRGDAVVTIWDRLRDWRQMAQDRNPQLISQLGPFTLSPLISELEKASQQNPVDLCFCHFDLQHGNIMMAHNGGEIRFIDYEYACLGPIEFDLANHWCEWCADYGKQNPHLLDLALFPTPHQQRAFIHHYLTSLSALLQSPPSGSADFMESLSNGTSPMGYSLHSLGPSWKKLAEIQSGVTDTMVESFRLRVIAYVPLSHFLWSLWGVVQAATSDITKFDFAGYAKERLSIYNSLSNGLL